MRTLVAAWVLAALALFFFQDELVWHPSGPPNRTPAAAHLPYADLTLVTADGVELEAWRIDAPNPQGALLYCHGNSGSIGSVIGVARELRELRFTTLLLEYRGYGNSAGTLSEAGTYLDAEAGYEALRAAGFPPERIVAWGHSLGGGVAIELARRHPLAALVTESTFTSVPDVGAERFPFLPVRQLARIHYDNRAKAAELNAVPWLLIHSGNDTIVRYHHGEQLFAAAAAARHDVAAAAPLLLHRTMTGHFGADLEDPADRKVVAAFLAAAVAPR